MSRLPIRVRVAAAFAVAMALVLAGTGAFLYVSLGHDLDVALDQELQLRAEDLSQLARDPRGSLAGEPSVRLIEPGESFAQLLTPAGRVVDATPPLRGRSLLSAAQLAAASRHARFAELPRIPGLDEGVRLLALPVRRDAHALVLVVGATAENRREALRSLRDELLVAGPIALLLATGVGYLLAGAGLRSVDAMRARAAQISADLPDERLPVPPTGDELQRLGTTLNEMLARLRAALARERDFVADAGHELRTPLALMRAELEYALHYAEGEDELRAALRTAAEETERLAGLSASLLLIASSDNGRLPLRTEPVDVAALLDGTRERFAWRSQELGRAIVTEPAQLTVTADRLRLEQALASVVDNALRHGAGAVHLSGTRDAGAIVLRVRDEGGGFDPEVLPRAFDRFSRGAAERRYDGAGLGLAIVQTIARAHGGEAVAANAVDGGATVEIRLPGRPTGGSG